MIKGKATASELNSFAPIRACRPWRVIRGQMWLAGILVLLSFPNAFADSDFSAFWKKFKSAVIAGDKATVAEMTKFPLSMSYLQKAVKTSRSSCVVMTKSLKARPMPRNVLKALNRTKNPTGGMGSIALSRRPKRLGKRTDSLHF